MLSWWLRWSTICLQCRRHQFDPWEDPLEEGMATHSSILAWRLSWTEKPDGYSHWACTQPDMTVWVTNTFTYMPLLLSCSVLSNFVRPSGLRPANLFCPWNHPDRNTGVGCHVLLQGIFPIQYMNSCLLCPYIGRGILQLGLFGVRR